MKILYIGAGFVGTCSGAVAASSGHTVLVYDIDEKKIQMLSSNDRDIIESCLFEQGLGDLIIRNKERITFTASYSQVENFLDDCSAVFMCLPTPEIGETGESDLKYYTAALSRLAGALAKRNKNVQSQYVVIVNKSTLPISSVDFTNQLLEDQGVKNYGIISNPEFLVEGKAVEGSLRPNRIVVGAEKDQDFIVMRQVYQRFCDSPNVHYIEINPREAEASKLLSNFYLFNKLTLCFDVIGRTCEVFENVKFENVRRVLTTDPRIGEWGFFDSLYAGGSCFIKDARSLSHQLQLKGQSAFLVDETNLANKRQLELFFSRGEREGGIEWKNKRVGLLGLSFKRDTNDVRNSPSVDLVSWLLEKQVAGLNVYDPVATENFKKLFLNESRIKYALHEKEALAEVDAVIIATDWPQFRSLADLLLLSSARPLIMDGRRMLQHRYEDLQIAGFTIIAVGSPLIKSS